MAQSLNTKVMFITKANVFIGLIGKKHGQIQSPWTEIDKVRAQLFFKDPFIRGFFIDTKSAGLFNFVVKNT